MPTASRTAPAAALVLAACGSRSDPHGAGDDGGPVRAAALCPSDVARYGGPPSSEPTIRPSGTPTALPLPSVGGDGVAVNGVKITALYPWDPESGCAGVGHSADFEVTNQQTQTATYTLTFGFLSASGGPRDTAEQTVEAVEPGRTVKGTVVTGETVGHAPEVTEVEVIKVRRVWPCCRSACGRSYGTRGRSCGSSGSPTERRFTDGRRDLPSAPASRRSRGGREAASQAASACWATATARRAARSR
jgi:hypothetical protein